MVTSKNTASPSTPTTIVGENYDRIFDADYLPIRHEGTETFECGFCEGERAVFKDREALFKDHLFEPFGDWPSSQAQARRRHRVPADRRRHVGKASDAGKL